MKRFFIIFLFVTTTVAVGYSQSATSSSMKAGKAVLQLKEESFDFGKIRQGRPVTHDFEVINKSDVPLVIDNVQASCGCTSPEWSSEPVAPGGSSIVKVGFNAGAQGHFSKTITVHYNGGQVETIGISGEVYPAPTTSAPLNSSLSLLKTNK